MHIAIAGLGYVGLSLACLLSKHNDVVAVDIDRQRVNAISKGVSPIKDPLIEEYLSKSPRKIRATADSHDAYRDAELVIIATPTDYDDSTHSFDTTSIETVLHIVDTTANMPIVVIKSTVPVGYTKQIAKRYPNLTIMFSPEFLREGHALDDNLHPSRIIAGIVNENDKPKAVQFAALLREGAEDPSVPTRVMGSTEAEAIKLFANTYLALRVSFFNELDTYAEVKGINSAEIIDGVCLDPRIGSQYNNPSFGYGGYCLPKDSKQLLSNYENVPQNLIRAIVDSNKTRKEFIADSIIARKPKCIGVYRLAMKEGSDNFRQSSILDIIMLLRKRGMDIVIYEPSVNGQIAFSCPVVHNLKSFFEKCDLIIANRCNRELAPVRDKVYTRDLWQRD